MLPPSLHLQRRSAMWGIHPTATVPSFSCRPFSPRSVWRKRLQRSLSPKQVRSLNLCFSTRNPVPLRRKKSAPFLNPPFFGILWQTTRCPFSETTGSGSMRAVETGNGRRAYHSLSDVSKPFIKSYPKARPSVQKTVLLFSWRFL